jgi:hypothetical protein
MINDKTQISNQGQMKNLDFRFYLSFEICHLKFTSQGGFCAER